MTRKDRLYKNLQKMQQEKGLKNFNFIPTTFLLPYEFEDFSGERTCRRVIDVHVVVSLSAAAFQRERGFWIIKPVASSQGKGIFLINHVSPAERHAETMFSCPSPIKCRSMKTWSSADTSTIRC
jgi:tubulin polyglutamylase TTLL5